MERQQPCAASSHGTILPDIQRFVACTCAQAASEAYDATLAPIHTYLVRMAIKTSIYLLPDRATFIASIGETGAGLPLPSVTSIYVVDRAPSFLHRGDGYRLRAIHV